MSLRERLVARQLPQRTVTLSPVVEGADPDVVTVRALPAGEWDALVQLHPPTEEQKANGWQWNVATFRPALLAACAVSDDEVQLDEADWAQLLLVTPVGDRERLFGAAIDVNDNRWPGAELGKGSR